MLKFSVYDQHKPCLSFQADAISTLEKENDYREEHFDFIQQHVRRFCLCCILYKEFKYNVYMLSVAMVRGKILKNEKKFQVREVREFHFQFGIFRKNEKKTWKSQGISKMFLNINCFCKQHSCFNIYGLRFFLKIKSASIDICSKSLNCQWMTIAKIGLPKGFGKRSKVREKSVKSQGILKRILSGNPVL